MNPKIRIRDSLEGRTDIADRERIMSKLESDQ